MTLEILFEALEKATSTEERAVIIHWISELQAAGQK